MRKIRFVHVGIGVAVVLLISVAVIGYGKPTTSHLVIDAKIGSAGSSAEMTQSLLVPGPVVFQKILAAEHTIPLGNYIELDHPKTRAAGIEQKDLNTQTYFYAIKHPKFGLFLIDSGVSHLLRERSNVFQRTMLDQIPVEVKQSTAEWLAAQGNPNVSGVFLTHIHIDHFAGVIDVPKDAVIYLGKEGLALNHWSNYLIGDTVDNYFDGFGPLEEWNFTPDPAGKFDGLIDIFGDGSVWAIFVPGHTPGSVAYLVNSTEGPKLIIGDAIHTRIGWELELPQAGGDEVAVPAERSAAKLRQFARDFPSIEVHLGHQPIGEPQMGANSD